MGNDPAPRRPVVGRRPDRVQHSVTGLGELADLLGGESQRSRRFLGGLVIGALVGAALAGSSFLRRRPRR